jgi:hypothetical protein
MQRLIAAKTPAQVKASLCAVDTQGGETTHRSAVWDYNAGAHDRAPSQALGLHTESASCQGIGLGTLIIQTCCRGLRNSRTGVVCGSCQTPIGGTMGLARTVFITHIMGYCLSLRTSFLMGKCRFSIAALGVHFQKDRKHSIYPGGAATPKPQQV